MPSRDSQTVILSRQTILLVTAVGVGLLTLCYVLGVQVGKQSAAMRRPAARGAGEDLQELPAAIDDQLKALESTLGEEAAGSPKPAPAPAADPADAKPVPPVEVRMGGSPQTAAAGPAAAKPSPIKPAAANPAAAKPSLVKPSPVKPVPAEAGPARKADDGARWTLQVMSTPDPSEAQRMIAKIRAAGFPATMVSDRGLFKVRLSQSGSRDAMDATTLKLKNRGFKPFPIKVE